MKRFMLVLFVLAGAWARAEEINSDVIHNYNFLALRYGYEPDAVGSSDANGGIVELSADVKNIIFDVSASYAVANTSPELNLWNLTGTVGYAIRLLENRVNIIPRIGGGYYEADASGLSASTTTIEPGLAASFAFNNWLSIGAAYRYVYATDTETHVNDFSVGPQVALGKKIGFDFRVDFNDHGGFSGVEAGFSFHY